MAGEWLLDQMNKRGGVKSEYADIQFGTVISAEPLEIQIDEKIILPESFLIIGKNVTDHDQLINIDGSDKTIKIKNKLQKDDEVALFRLDGGQLFYVFEKMN